MPADDPNAHSASIHVDVPPEAAFDFLADGMNQTYWALGSWDRKALGDDVFTGTSLFDGGQLFIKLHPSREHLLVDFSTGPSPEQLRHRVEARVLPGENLGRDPGSCVVTLTVWRPESMAPDVWARTYHAFKTEVHLIKGRLEGAGS